MSFSPDSLHINRQERKGEITELAFATRELCFRAFQEVYPEMIKHAYQEDFGMVYRYLEMNNYNKAVEALECAGQIHDGLRKDGVTPWLHHQVMVLGYVIGYITSYGVDKAKSSHDIENVYIATILHDTLEDFPDKISFEEMADIFGTIATKMVDLLTKKFQKRDEEGEERYFDELLSDPFLPIIKGCDRIHNLQTMDGVFKPEKIDRYVSNTETYVIPLLRGAIDYYPDYAYVYCAVLDKIEEEIQPYRFTTSSIISTPAQ